MQDREALRVDGLAKQQREQRTRAGVGQLDDAVTGSAQTRDPARGQVARDQTTPLTEVFGKVEHQRPPPLVDDVRGPASAHHCPGISSAIRCRPVRCLVSRATRPRMLDADGGDHQPGDALVRVRRWVVPVGLGGSRSSPGPPE